MINLSQKIVRLHNALQARNVDHAFGGALALAWCTQHARGTIDIDLNIFVNVEAARDALEAMPAEVTWSEKDLEVIQREGQQRIWWDTTPIDVFLNTMKLHEQMARRCRWEQFAGTSVPFLSCQDLAILKAFFNRTKDWADLEAMQAAGTLNTQAVIATVVELLGADDERIAKLTALVSQ